MVFVSPSHCYVGWSVAFLEMAEHLSAHGKWWMNSLFSLLYLLNFVSACEVLRIYPSDSSPRASGRGLREWLCGSELPAGVIPPHNQFHTLFTRIDDMRLLAQGCKMSQQWVHWDPLGSQLIYWAITVVILGLNSWQNCVTEHGREGYHQFKGDIRYHQLNLFTKKNWYPSDLLKIKYSRLFIKMQLWSVAFCSVPPH